MTMIDTIVSQDGRHRSSDPKLIAMHDTRNSPKKALVIRDDPFMIGFGKDLKKGDIVIIRGTVYQSGFAGFCVAVPSETAFYDYKSFEIIEEN